MSLDAYLAPLIQPTLKAPHVAVEKNTDAG